MKRRNDAPDAPAAQLLLRQAELHVGPLPPPATLKAYEDSLAGLADRIVVMAETEQKAIHADQAARHEETLLQLRSRASAEARAQFYAFLSVVLLTGGAVACAAFGATQIGVAIAGATILGVVASFLRSRKRP